MTGRVLYVGYDTDLPDFLEKNGSGAFSVASTTPERYAGEPADLLLWDFDAAPPPPAGGTRIVTVGYGEGAELSRPFDFSSFEKLLDPSRSSDAVALSSVGRELFVSGDGIRLSPLEYDLCRALLDADGEAVPTALLRTLGGRNLSLHALSVALSSLREKLARLPVPPRIEAKRNAGYRLIAPAGNG